MILVVVALMFVSFVCAFVFEKNTDKDMTAWHITNAAIASLLCVFILVAFHEFAGTFLWYFLFNM